jgi:hypothetical protein
VEMPESFMPSPCLIISTSGDAEGPGHLHVKHVHPIVPAVDLGEKMTVAVLDPEHPLVNLHPRATLVELAEADDGVPVGRDVVDPMEQRVLTSLGHEHDGLNVTDLQHGLVAELDGALDVEVQVGKVSDTSYHVVCGTTIEVPSLELVIVRIVIMEGSHVRLVDVE